MVSVSASEAGSREFYPGLCSFSVFAIICNEFARQACGKLTASSFHGDFEAFVNLLQACTLVMTSLRQACTLVMTNLWQACCKLKLLSGKHTQPMDQNHLLHGRKIRKVALRLALNVN
ncbi:hypothetical protein AVEN_135733-1 [Araneus ventricosus]|uniref:Uncharacterized protein n=1 Tax=Araneus ventricosus TaxID=182803 RepID=A0A4Y2W916_ARAVE|nr:hypothetical protein AVEN_135733-1 [Araneus ventricosus]